MEIRLKPEMEEMIRAKIEEGYASAQRGELLDADRVREEIEQRKNQWLAESRSARARISTGAVLGPTFPYRCFSLVD